MSYRDTFDQLVSACGQLIGRSAKSGSYTIESLGPIGTRKAFVGVTSKNDEEWVALILENAGTQELERLMFSNLHFFALKRPIFEVNEKEFDAPSEVLIVQMRAEHFIQFARLSADLLGVLEVGGTLLSIQELVLAWNEAFSKKTTLSDEKVLGLWGEMVFIANAVDHDEMAASWHSTPTANFDFVTSRCVYEVKTTVSGTRRHHLSSTQINEITPSEFNLVSIVTSSTDEGISIAQLKQKVLAKLSRPESMTRFLNCLAQECGSDIGAYDHLRWSMQHAVESISFYDLNEISRPTFSRPVISSTWIQNFDEANADLVAKREYLGL